jgi:serine/threonine-protein kinase
VVVPGTVSPPTRLGRFEVGAKIGGGGMATVYLGRATREDGTEERVALKVIRDELAHDERFSAMFVDEAKILARLSHKNVIHTLEYGITGAHRFIAMELLSGRPYADVWDALAAKGAKLPLELGAWICARVAEGLHSAHELVDDEGQSLSVIHRDVNPTNIFLTHEGAVKLIDFGLAKARMRVSQSADGIVKGKIPYLAPEQAQAKPIDRRIDVYALGTTLWETVMMKRLFKRDTDVDTLLAIRDAEVPDPRKTIEGFPDELFRIIDKALRRDRDERYATAADMQKDLDAFVGAAAERMPGELAMLLKGMFPGEEEKYVEWLRDATGTRIPRHTMPPPAPVPTASSTLLEQDPDAARDSARPAKGAAARADAAPAEKKREQARSSRPPASNKGASKKKNKKNKNRNKNKNKKTVKPAAAAAPKVPKKRPDVERSERPAAAKSDAAAPGAQHRMWISLAVVVAVLIVLALAFEHR